MAYYWEGEDGTSRVLSYREVNKLARALQDLGVKPGGKFFILINVYTAWR